MTLFPFRYESITCIEHKKKEELIRVTFFLLSHSIFSDLSSSSWSNISSDRTKRKKESIRAFLQRYEEIHLKAGDKRIMSFLNDYLSTIPSVKSLSSWHPITCKVSLIQLLDKVSTYVYLNERQWWNKWFLCSPSPLRIEKEIDRRTQASEREKREKRIVEWV